MANELQIYNIVQSITNQTMGAANLTVTGTQGLVSLGRTVLDSSTHTEEFLNTLVKRIGKTIISHRAYSNQFADMIVDDFQWGAILQKIKVDMPTAEADQSYLTDGVAVDHYVVNKPTAKQKLFMTDTPYQFKITIQREHLKEAFTSESAMGAFISAIYGEVQNAINLALEDLGRLCLANFMAEMPAGRVINLVTEYNAKVDASKAVTSATALTDEGFLRYAIGRIKLISKRMTMMSTKYNDGSVTRHTPYEMQKLYVLADFETALETQVEYAAFNEQYVKLDGFKEVAYWQAISNPAKIDIARASDNAEVTTDQIVCCLIDRDAVGIYKKDNWTATTPFNAAGGYVNTFWHEKQLWFNDLSENGVMFTLN